MFKKLRIEGRENLNKKDKYILIANHSSLFDIVAIVSFYPEVSWFGHERLLKIPIFKSYLKLKYGFPETRIRTMGNGPDQPVATNDTEAGRALNRRTDIRVYPNPAGR